MKAVREGCPWNQGIPSYQGWLPGITTWVYIFLGGIDHPLEVTFSGSQWVNSFSPCSHWRILMKRTQDMYPGNMHSLNVEVIGQKVTGRKWGQIWSFLAWKTRVTPLAVRSCNLGFGTVKWMSNLFFFLYMGSFTIYLSVDASSFRAGMKKMIDWEIPHKNDFLEAYNNLKHIEKW